MMAGDKNGNFTLCKTSRIGTFHKVVQIVFQNKKPNQTVEPAQYGLEINFKLEARETIDKNTIAA